MLCFSSWSDSLASVQIHQSAFGNLVGRLELNGATLTLAELRQRVVDRLGLPDLLPEETENDDVVITFAPTEAVTIRCHDGALQYHFSANGETVRSWSEDPILVAAPSATTTYDVEVRCSTLVSCADSETVVPAIVPAGRSTTWLTKNPSSDSDASSSIVPIPVSLSTSVALV